MSFTIAAWSPGLTSAGAAADAVEPAPRSIPPAISVAAMVMTRRFAREWCVIATPWSHGNNGEFRSGARPPTVMGWGAAAGVRDGD
ncbi:hypothetical protein Sros01_44510 [Streptomyces roseochromogenus]|nr:hypothetical protein Sros01_44510 [Streptomyces roseochromogenus]